MATMTASEAARRLGVKVETLYAYVSRGVLERETAADGRSSLFDSRAIESLARRGRPRQSSRDSSINMLIETRTTSLSMQGVRYRGHLSNELARTHTFEDVAELLWLGAVGSSRQPWSGDVIPALTMSRHTPIATPDAMRIIATWIAASPGVDASQDAVGGPNMTTVDPTEVARCGRYLVATVVDSLPVLGDGRTPRLVLPCGSDPIRGTIAGRLWTRLSPRRPAPGMLAVLNAALVLLADHELATSTLAVRVAASTRADPYAVVNAGLAVVSGPLHGGASLQARRLIEDALSDGAGRAVERARQRHRRVPGFGHSVYAGADPRAVVLFDLLRRVAGINRTLLVIDDVIEIVGQRFDRAPNIDIALAAMTHVCGMPEDAGEAVMATARIAGWLAHAIEEYGETPLRFRPRASYIGPHGAPS